MRTRRSWLRFGLLAFLLATFLGPIGAGAGSSVSCDDFANPDAAQYLLDNDDAYAEDLDPNGDGVACNEDDARDDESNPDGDYLDTIATEVVGIETSFDTFFEVMLSYHDDMTDSEVLDISNELDDIAAMWADYPDSAPDLDAPEAYDDIDGLYREWAAQVGAAGEGWQDYQVIVRDGTDAEINDGLVAFDEAQIAARDLASDLLDLVEDEGGEAQTTPGHDDDASDDEESGDLTADEYLAAVDDHFNELLDSFEDFNDLVDSGDITEDDRETLYAIYDTWASAADVAAGIQAPEGYEDLHAAYLDVANGFTELYNRYAAWLETESGTDESDDAFAAYDEQIDILNDFAIVLDQMLTDAS